MGEGRGGEGRATGMCLAGRRAESLALDFFFLVFSGQGGCGEGRSIKVSGRRLLGSWRWECACIGRIGMVVCWCTTRGVE